MDNKQTQCSAILEHLYLNQTTGITQLEATNLYGITRLPARISDLRKAGYNIIMIKEKGLNRYGKPTNYGRYYLRSST